MLMELISLLKFSLQRTALLLAKKSSARASPACRRVPYRRDGPTSSEIFSTIFDVSSFFALSCGIFLTARQAIQSGALFQPSVDDVFAEEDPSLSATLSAISLYYVFTVSSILSMNMLEMVLIPYCSSHPYSFIQ